MAAGRFLLLFKQLKLARGGMMVNDADARLFVGIQNRDIQFDQRLVFP